jgi:hypothetical protein
MLRGLSEDGRHCPKLEQGLIAVGCAIRGRLLRRHRAELRDFAVPWRTKEMKARKERRDWHPAFFVELNLRR